MMGPSKWALYILVFGWSRAWMALSSCVILPEDEQITKIKSQMTKDINQWNVVLDEISPTYNSSYKFSIYSKSPHTHTVQARLTIKYLTENTGLSFKL